MLRARHANRHERRAVGRSQVPDLMRPALHPVPFVQSVSVEMGVAKAFGMTLIKETSPDSAEGPLRPKRESPGRMRAPFPARIRASGAGSAGRAHQQADAWKGGLRAMPVLKLAQLSDAGSGGNRSWSATQVAGSSQVNSKQGFGVARKGRSPSRESR